jgi:hypothetical protein
MGDERKQGKISRKRGGFHTEPAEITEGRRKSFTQSRIAIVIVRRKGGGEIRRP